MTSGPMFIKWSAIVERAHRWSDVANTVIIRVLRDHVGVGRQNN